MRRPLLSLALLIGCAAAPPARADEAADYRRMIEQQKSMQETNLKNLPALPGKKRIDEILGVVIEDGKLAVKSPLLSDDAAKQTRNRQVRVDVAGLEGISTLIVQQQNGVANNNFYFNFNNISYPNLDSISNLSISMQLGLFQVARATNSRTKHSNINLTQSTGRSIYGQPDGVQLSVYSGDNTGRMNVGVNFSEPDFATLRRKHPREVNEHLRPLLRELRLESIFAVDATTAWQVFSDEWKGNAAVAAQVTALLAGLEVDNYADREKARRAIKQLGPEVALVIYRMDRTGLTDEQNCQLDTVLAGHSSLSRPEARHMVDDIDFLLDCLYSDDLAVRTIALKHLDRVAKRELAFDPADDYDKRVVRVEALRSELVRRPAPTTKPAAKG